MAQEVPVKAYSKQDLVRLYGISDETLRRWLKRVKGLTETAFKSQILTPSEVKLIFDHLGAPTENENKRA